VSGNPGPRSVAITGAAGYIGKLVVERLAREPGSIETLVAVDRREPPAPAPAAAPGAAAGTGARFEPVVCDVRSPDLADVLRRHAVETVVHLASIVTPGRGETREVAYSVDVLGTRNVLEACAAAGVSHLVVASSGAAYGFHADNPEWLSETDALRGNETFAYAHHKRLVEEMLARWRAERPELRQLVLRPGTVLGRATRNQITDLFEKPVILGVRGAAGPFVFVWDEDVALCIAIGVRERRAGVFNLAGDGVLTLRDIAARTGKPYVRLPAALLRGALALLGRAGLTQYGPEQVDFIRYRSALANDALKRDFGFTPRLGTRDVFELYWRARTAAAAAAAGTGGAAAGVGGRAVHA